MHRSQRRFQLIERNMRLGNRISNGHARAHADKPSCRLIHRLHALHAQVDLKIGGHFIVETVDFAAEGVKVEHGTCCLQPAHGRRAIAT